MTPYEQRFNYYMAAKDLLIEKYHADFNAVTITANNPKYILSELLPKFPTEDEIFALAESIKYFAEKK